MQISLWGESAGSYCSDRRLLPMRGGTQNPFKRKVTERLLTRTEALSSTALPDILLKSYSCKTTLFCVTLILSLLILDLEKTSLFDITWKQIAEIVSLLYLYTLNSIWILLKGDLEVEVWKFVHGPFLPQTLLLVSTCILSQAIINQNFDSGNCVVVFKVIQQLEVTQVSLFVDYWKQRRNCLMLWLYLASL